MSAKADGACDVIQLEVNLGPDAALVADEQVLGEAAAWVADGEHHDALLGVIELRADHADKAERHIRVTREEGLEIRAMDAAE